MSTTLVSPLNAERIQAAETRLASPSLQKWAFVMLLTVAAIAIHGYHPYSEDAGIYVPAIKKLLNPELYPHSAPRCRMEVVPTAGKIIFGAC